MEEQIGFNIKNQDWTKEDLEVIFTPDSSIVQYEYEVLKDGETFYKQEIDNKEPSSFLFTKTGTYQIKVVTTNQNGKTRSFISGLYKIDKDAPVIQVGVRQKSVKEGSKFSPLNGVSATDKQDGNLTSKITTNYDSSFEKPLAPSKAPYGSSFSSINF